MFSGLATKLALKKVGLSADTFNFSSPATDPPPKESKNNRDLNPDRDADEESSPWPAWMTVKSLPLTVQPWLAPPPPPIPLAALPKIGDQAPLDRDRKVTIGGGRCVLIVFLRCVGCAFAQKTFLSLRTLANRYPNDLTCIAVSHSSAAATQKWMDLMGGAWNVQVVIDEDRSVYAAWGLGLGTVWSVLNPTTQIQAWKEKGWLGAQVATAIQRKGTAGRGMASYQTGGTGVIDVEGPVTVMGNKWQSAGAWAVNGSGVIVWGRKAATPDDLMDLDESCKALGL
ncbi:hypothetical protein jhhlp_004066 [Lomentospora prolificans]|uniref:Alkyl hydroperoxide reductase subunit C/ Thiol specific antioxidant domain-containing protein n=1 Tax=Lomentospora prolificans TaxID=41688 RepID=A0A2N3NAJ2_9PEZI|nr:hypothetical protein jhhlp_004066 [Lomentospora prolificans]